MENIDITYWLRIIASYDRKFNPWMNRVEKILNKYKDGTSVEREPKGARFNILWSNIQTIIPAVFARLPKPDISRRFKDNDPVGRVASLIIERALEFEVEHYSDYYHTMRNCVFDRFLGGRGICWIRYDPHFKTVMNEDEENGFEITEDVTNEEIDYECATVDYVSWRDFGHQVARTWEEVSTLWRIVYMSREMLIERFGEELGERIPLDSAPESVKNDYTAIDDALYQAKIYEIWDKKTKKVLWISKSLNKILDEIDDPMGLEYFFPCPRPLFATITTESLVPTPDYVIYQDQSHELDLICNRIDGLVNALQIKGVYDASIPSLKRLFTEANNTDLIPVDNWNAFSEKQGLRGSIDLIDLQPIAFALMEAYKAMDQIKGQIYELTGISDIVRGKTDASETATAQQIKGQYGNMRLKTMQNDVAQFATEILQIKAEIICKFFTEETILKISGAQQFSPEDQQLIPQALELLKNEPLRNFRITISSDSLIQMDEIQEKQDRLEFLKATSSFIQQAVPAVQAAPEIVPLLMEMLKFGVTAFKVGKTMEGEFDAMADKVKQMATQPQNKPNPEMMKIQAEMQSRQQEMQLDMQTKQQEMQMKFSIDKQSAQLQMQMEQHKQQVQAQQVESQNQLEAQRNQMSADNEKQLELLRMQNESRIEEMRSNIQLLIAKINNEAKIEVAEISAQSVLDNSQILSANESTNNNYL